MGRIRTTLIKRTTHELIRRHGSEFKGNFADNQNIVNKLVSIRSKVLKNKIAGYITKLIKRRDSPED